MYVQEQIKANHWLSEIGRIKTWSSDFEYANTREEIIQILGHLALGLYELTKSKDTETDGAVGSDERVLECFTKGISTILEDIAAPKTSASRNSAMTIHGNTEFLQTSVRPVDSCALLCAKTQHLGRSQNPNLSNAISVTDLTLLINLCAVVAAAVFLCEIFLTTMGIAWGFPILSALLLVTSLVLILGLGGRLFQMAWETFLFLPLIIHSGK